METVVHLTDRAIANVRRFQGDDESGVLRLGVRGGGCSGFEYALTLDHPQEADVIYEQAGVRVAVDSEAVGYLRGATLDFKEAINIGDETGFVFDNPNATSSCGCGTSFRVDGEPGCSEESAV